MTGASEMCQIFDHLAEMSEAEAFTAKAKAFDHMAEERGRAGYPVLAVDCRREACRCRARAAVCQQEATP